MTEPAIRVQGLAKKYLLRHEQPERYTALRDVIAHRFRSLGRGLRVRRGAEKHAGLPPEREEFWALRDVSFEVARGERLGIIGRNGAGKSTLLKILSRITSPTAGRIELEGRVASLLEVGTGFHPELTGRENVFLNGAILGMGRGEIRRKFDEIVAFAEVEKFLDTPVKRYSTGMYLRLAFAVAAHLEPEILIVDEVLAVGDAEFQKKCLGKMSEVGESGKTVLFVSHNMGAIATLCTRGIYLDQGRVAYDGGIDACVSRYRESWSEARERVVDLAAKRRPAGHALRDGARLQSIEMLSGDGAAATWQTPFPENPVFRVRVKVRRQLPALELGIALYNSGFIEVASSLSSDNLLVENVAPGTYVFTAQFLDAGIMPGTYALGLGLKSGTSDIVMEDYLPEAVSFEVAPSEVSFSLRAHTRRGAIIPKVGYAFSPAGPGE